MALRLLLAFFPFIAVAEIEENCNMQLQALQSGNSGDAVGLDGYTSIPSTACTGDGRNNQVNSPAECADFCDGCAFEFSDGFLSLSQGQAQAFYCTCCEMPLDLKGGPFTLYTKNSCFSTTATPNDPGPSGDAVGLDGYTSIPSTACTGDGRNNQVNSPAECADFCDGCAFEFSDGFLSLSQGQAQAFYCTCCEMPLDLKGGPFTLYTKNSCFSTTATPNDPGPDPPGIVDGDPHIQTLDGLRYTLLKQGTFSLWHFSGFKTHVHSPSKRIMQAFPVDWQVYVHYSGDKSFTKALLLVDKTGGSLRQALELTSDDCIWKGRTANTPWKAIDDNQLIHKPEESGLYVSGFNVSTGNRVKLNMNSEHGNTDVAVLVASCRPHHHMNLKMKMQGRKYHQFVDGEFGRHRAGLSVLQMSAGSSDSEFAISSAWEDLGGSTITFRDFHLDPPKISHIFSRWNFQHVMWQKPTVKKKNLDPIALGFHLWLCQKNYSSPRDVAPIAHWVSLLM